MDIVFKETSDHLIANVAGIKTVDLFNNQFERMLEDQPDDHPIDFPCVMIEFLPIQWTTGGNKSQTGRGLIRAHIGHELYQDTHDKSADRPGALDALCYRKKVHEQLQGFAASNTGKFNRIATIPDTNYGNFIVMVEEYEYSIEDNTAWTLKNYQEVTPDLNLEKGNVLPD